VAESVEVEEEEEEERTSFGPRHQRRRCAHQPCPVLPVSAIFPTKYYILKAGDTRSICLCRR
jgi:hypothetical protein